MKILGIYPSEQKKAYIEYKLDSTGAKKMSTYRRFVETYPEQKSIVNSMLKEMSNQ